jgi:TonB family protein
MVHRAVAAWLVLLALAVPADAQGTWARGGMPAVNASRPIDYVPPVFVQRAANQPGELVILAVFVGTDGKVVDVAGVEGPRDQAAAPRDAVRQWTFPILAEGPSQVFVGFNTAAQQARPEQPRPQTPIPGFRKIRDVKPQYPAEARNKGIKGLVLVDTIVDAKGLVAAARVVKGDPLLAVASLRAVLQWQFAPPGLPLTMTLTTNFALQAP